MTMFYSLMCENWKKLFKVLLVLIHLILRRTSCGPKKYQNYLNGTNQFYFSLYLSIKQTFQVAYERGGMAFFFAGLCTPALFGEQRTSKSSSLE